MALLIFENVVGPAHVFELHGTLDGDTADKLSPRVRQAIDEGHRVIIFDLTKLSYVSSAGLTVFLSAYRRLQDGGHVRFVGLQPDVRQVFDITALTARVELYDTLEDALVGPRP